LFSGIVTNSDATNIEGNLIANLKWTGSYDGRSEAFNIRYEGAVAAIGSTDLILKNNYASGSQRVGYWVPGEDCTSTDTNYENNVAAGNLMGVAVMIHDPIPYSCARYAGFTVFKNRDYGIYYNNMPSLEVKDNIFADNTAALFPMVVEPNPLSHECSLWLSNQILSHMNVPIRLSHCLIQFSLDSRVDQTAPEKLLQQELTSI